MSPHSDRPIMYRDLASWFHLLTPPADYEVEARFYGQALTQAARIPVKRVLELGSGGGNNASFLKADFDLTLVDLSEEMLALSRSLNPTCEHEQGDMRTVRLGSHFDGVFIHDAIDYMTTEADLRAAFDTAFAHCASGGAAIFAPDHVRETFAPTTDHGGSDGPDRGLRYLEWTWDPDPEDDTYRVDYAFLLKDADGGVGVEHDQHTCGLFSRSTWIRLIEEAGFQVQVLAGIDGETAPDVFAATKP